MRTVTEMLRTNPKKTPLDSSALANCIAECVACAQTCTACADACLGEQHIDMLRRCIRLNLDCADVCEATARLLSRQLEPDAEILRRQVELCALACKACGDECAQHANMHEHCRVCMEACRRCEEACSALASSMAAQSGVSPH